MASAAGKGRKDGQETAQTIYLADAQRGTRKPSERDVPESAYPCARFIKGQFLSATFADEPTLLAICK